MPKFRSWNKKRNKFFYWENGFYLNEIAKDCLCIGGVENFNWQNAEQLLNAVKDQQTFYNDFILLTYYEKKKIEFPMTDIIEPKKIKGRVLFDKFGIYIISNIGKIYLCDLDAFNWEIIGNIHEGEK